MSDSDSSSASTASDSRRGGSPEPELVPAAEREPAAEFSTTADENQDKPAREESPSPAPDAENQPETEASPPVEEEPDPDAEPLHFTWEGEGHIDPASTAADFVVIHGVYGGWENESQAGPGSGSSAWVANYAASLESPSRILRFEYEPLQLFCGRRSRQAIRNCALKLLRALAARRRHESQVCGPQGISGK
ncbi:hypothetical protein Trco_002963 [Trichoderma cornu-damae]|uniref:Uncharacterized protein n=1 Tax=Trichoderma cornu-damae TaxID=654480 RepID=A0A9P8QVW4_9HYPO|nr:hypothetical protein Trco_002963 [Trichoderma cornu-damae]